jgi:hypothetical protein|tara:strand:- start:443 stop:691 length:249 start_codon:yes stop_codon:yes gene_type:complete
MELRNDPLVWAVQPAAWFNFDEHGAVYCADISTAYTVAGQQLDRHGDQMIWKMTAGDPIRWVRVYADEQVSAVTVQELEHLV